MIKAFTVFTIFAILITIVSASCPSTCQASKEVGDCVSYTADESYCACQSGKSGANCDVNYAASTCTPSEPSATATDFVPTLKRLDFNNNLLRIEVQSPYVKNRVSTQVALGGKRENAKCHYPGPGWTKSNDDTECADVYTSSLNWTLTGGDSCDWSFDGESDANYFIYRAELTVKHQDIVPFNHRNSLTTIERTTVHAYPIRLNFPKFVSMSATVTAQAKVDVHTAVISQVASSLTKSAKIVFVTNTPFPYKLKSPFVGTAPATLVAGISETTASTCPDDATSSCTQKWEVTIDAGVACVVDGNYRLDFTLACQSSGADKCAVTTGSDAMSIQLSLKSENLCAETSTELAIGTSLTAYHDAERTVIADQFFAGSTIYWRMAALSDSVTIDDVKLASVGIRAVDTGKAGSYVYTSGMTQSADDTFKITSDGKGKNYVDFQMDVVAANGFVLSADESIAYELQSRLDVSYSGVDDKHKKRTIEVASDLNNKLVAAKETFTIAASTFESSAAANTAPIAAVAAVAAIALQIMF